HRFLTDPMWSERVGPVGFAGPKRFFPPLLAVRDLPPVDAVLISHDHYDHLDYATIVALKDRAPRFVCPLGVGAHLERWGVPAAKITELDWWDSRSFTLVCNAGADFLEFVLSLQFGQPTCALELS